MVDARLQSDAAGSLAQRQNALQPWEGVSAHGGASLVRCRSPAAHSRSAQPEEPRLQTAPDRGLGACGPAVRSLKDPARSFLCVLPRAQNPLAIPVRGRTVGGRAPVH